ncbi:MAG: hypothetical protein LUG26_03595 [Ruminococcus sp.]|nr:hypothetical protein [Ruminococcus sp.]
MLLPEDDELLPELFEEELPDEELLLSESDELPEELPELPELELELLLFLVVVTVEVDAEEFFAVDVVVVLVVVVL